MQAAEQSIVTEQEIGKMEQGRPQRVPTRAAARLLPGLLLAVTGLAAASTAAAGQPSPTLQTGDLYRVPTALSSEGTALSCMMLNDGAFEELGECARRNLDGSYTVARDTLRKLDFDRWSLASIVIREHGYAYVRRDGRALIVPTFDNAPDEFVDGLVRVRVGKKLGYADRRLKLVIPAIYDGAHRLDTPRGRAWACIDCETVTDGEHSWYRGGTAVCLDRRGRQRAGAECDDAGWLPSQLRE